MNILRLALLWSLLLPAVAVSAQDRYDNTIYIEDAEALVDSEFTLSVKMRNSIEVEAFSFDLILPYGMELVADADGQPDVRLSEERTSPRRTDTFGAAVLTAYRSSAVRVIAASSSGSAIAPGDGEVCTVRVRVPAGMGEGRAYVVLRNISIVDTEAHSHDVEQMMSTITIRDLRLGDANGDGRLTVADMVAIAHYILGRPPVNFSVRAADVNKDRRVNVADYIALVHILGEDPTQSQGGFPRMPKTNPDNTTAE